MDSEATSLRQKMVDVLTRRGEQLTYRQLTDALWQEYPDFHKHMLSLNDGAENEARRKLRIRLGTEVKNYPNVFAATRSEGVVVVGLAATEDDAAVELEEEEEEQGGLPAVYWYTFPAYRRDVGAFPIKIGKGNNPQARILTQVTAMPEAPQILGQFEHAEASNLERALHHILKVRGKKKQDAPGDEWYLTTPAEVQDLVKLVLGK